MLELEMIFDPKVYIPLLWTVSIYIVLWIIKNILIARLKVVSARTTTRVDDVILNILSCTKKFFILGISLYAGFHISVLDKNYGVYADRFMVILVAVQLIVWGNEGVRSWIEFTLEKKSNDPSVKTSLGFLGIVLKFVVGALVVLSALNNLGVNVSTFITGLGVGGVAIALATQRILGDLFSSLSIVMDKPFLIGDSISFGEWSGTVEYIGLKSTKMRSDNGEQIIVSNSDLLAAKIRNFKRMKRRRVSFQLGLTYGAKRESLRKVPGIVEEIIKRHEQTSFDRAHFVRYGASSLDFDIVYFITTSAYKVYADTHEQILHEIGDALEAEGLSFAFPTQTVILEKSNPA